MLKNLWNRVPVGWRIPLVVAAALVLILGTWMYGANLKNHLGNWWYARGTAQSHEEIDKLKAQVADEQKKANDAVAAFEAEKLVTAEERKKRELAENILEDKSKTANEKLRAYEAIVNAPATHTGPQSTDELCARAKAHGIRCD